MKARAVWGLQFIAAATVLAELYSLWELSDAVTLWTLIRSILFGWDPVITAFLPIFCPFTFDYLDTIYGFNVGVAFALTALLVLEDIDSFRRNISVMLLFTTAATNPPDFFSRALSPLLSSQHSQTYYSLTVYFFLAFALCGLLAGLAYLFSLSTAQETEKRSEYECGFAPFDSATRLPFDVHFYLVGILFLIFDVEVALLFPWVLALRTTGWFGFYLMFSFLAILSLGFLYEWKRGALTWPARYVSGPMCASCIFLLSFAEADSSILLVTSFFLFGRTAAPRVPGEAKFITGPLFPAFVLAAFSSFLFAFYFYVSVRMNKALSNFEIYREAILTAVQTGVPTTQERVSTVFTDGFSPFVKFCFFLFIVFVAAAIILGVTYADGSSLISVVKLFSLPPFFSLFFDLHGVRAQRLANSVYLRAGWSSLVAGVATVIIYFYPILIYSVFLGLLRRIAGKLHDVKDTGAPVSSDTLTAIANLRTKLLAEKGTIANAEIPPLILGDFIFLFLCFGCGCMFLYAYFRSSSGGYITICVAPEGSSANFLLVLPGANLSGGALCVILLLGVLLFLPRKAPTLYWDTGLLFNKPPAPKPKLTQWVGSWFGGSKVPPKTGGLAIPTTPPLLHPMVMSPAGTLTFTVPHGYAPSGLPVPKGSRTVYFAGYHATYVPYGSALPKGFMEIPSGPYQGGFNGSNSSSGSSRSWYQELADLPLEKRLHLIFAGAGASATVGTLYYVTVRSEQGAEVTGDRKCSQANLKDQTAHYDLQARGSTELPGVSSVITPAQAVEFHNYPPGQRAFGISFGKSHREGKDNRVVLDQPNSPKGPGGSSGSGAAPGASSGAGSSTPSSTLKHKFSSLHADYSHWNIYERFCSSAPMFFSILYFVLRILFVSYVLFQRGVFTWDFWISRLYPVHLFIQIFIYKLCILRNGKTVLRTNYRPPVRDSSFAAVPFYLLPARERRTLMPLTCRSMQSFSPLFLVIPLNGTLQELTTILFSPTGFMFLAVFLLHRLALLYRWSLRSKRVQQLTAIRVLWAIGAVIFFVSLYCSYFLSFALAVVFFVSSYLEMNPFWPARSYWRARVTLFSLPWRLSPRPYRFLLLVWGSVFFVFAAIWLYESYITYVPWVPPAYKEGSFLYEYESTSLWQTLLRHFWPFLPHLYSQGVSLATPYTYVLEPMYVSVGNAMSSVFTQLGFYNTFALLLLFWMAFSTAISYIHGGTSFTILGTLYQKQAGDPKIAATMRYLWIELRFLAVITAVVALLYLMNWDLISVTTKALLINLQMDIIDGFHHLVVRILAAPGEALDFLNRTLHRVTDETEKFLRWFWPLLKSLPALAWRFKFLLLWLLFCVRGYYYTSYIHRQETKTYYGKFIYTFSLLLNVYVIPFVTFFYFSQRVYRRLQILATPYYAKYCGPAKEENLTQLTSPESTEKSKGQALPFVLATVIVVDCNGVPTGLDPQIAFSSVKAASELGWSLMSQLASAEIFYGNITYVIDILFYVVICLAIRTAQLLYRWRNLEPVSAATPVSIVKKYTWAPRKVSLLTWLLSWFAKNEFFVDNTADINECNDYLLSEITAIEQKISTLYPALGFLLSVCLLLLAINSYVARICQHHDALLHGIRTDGALVVIPQTGETSSKAILLTGGAFQGDPLSPMYNELFTSQLSGFPLLAEILLFILICAVITKLSSDLGKEHSKRFLAYTSWRILSLGMFALIGIYLCQFIFDTGSAAVLGGYFATSRTITLLKLITLISAVFVLDASEMFMRQHSRHLLEYPIMVALTTFFMLLLVSANHVMSTFLSLVGFSLGLYVLILYDANRRPSREAGLKYYYLSTLSSGLVLYGILLIYTLTGTGNFDELFFLFNAKVYFQENALLRLALLIVLAGFFFKLSAFPGHLWAADVYEGSPSPVTAFFMLPVKIVVLGAFIRLFSIALAPLAAFWLPLLTLAVIISIVWGALASVQEKKVRRFLAYASINQMGFLLMGLTTDSDEGYQAAILYIAVYAIMTCAFLAIFLSSRRQDGTELLYVSDFRTLASRNWLVGWSLAVVLFSMAGIPPLGGFFAKYFVLLHAFEKNLIFEVVVGLATSLISTYYYLRIIKIVKFEQPDGAMPSSPCLTPRRQSQLFLAEAFLWSFIVFAPAILSATWLLAQT